MNVLRQVIIQPNGVTIDGQQLNTQAKGYDMLREIYKQILRLNYPKFYKMDPLCQLGFIATELLLNGFDAPSLCDDCAIVLFGKSGSLVSDIAHQHNIQDPQHFFPSPAIFVYTLPNIVTGEIAIRHHIHNETAFFALPQDNPQLMRSILMAILHDDTDVNMAITGWLDCDDNTSFLARITLISND